jgi:histidine triad (HIT) family protein
MTSIIAPDCATVSAGCPFCDIVSGSSPADVVLDDEVATAFLDRAPVFKGHVLVVPRVHVVTLPDLDAALVGELFARVQRLASVVPHALDADGTFVAINNVVSQSVAHLHVHVVPRRRKDGLRGFFWPRQKYATGESARYADAIRAAL